MAPSQRGSRPSLGCRFLLTPTGWPYLLVPFIPLAVAFELAHAAAGLVFFAAALGVIPTAALMGRATEEVAAQSGPGSTRSSRPRSSARSWGTSCS